MNAAPPINTMTVLDDFVLEIDFDGLGTRYVDLKKFPLLGPLAERLMQDEDFLKSFKLLDGVPEWNGQALLGPEDLLEHSSDRKRHWAF